MSRNAACPGFSSLVELLMMSIKTNRSINNPYDPLWFEEYKDGVNNGVYIFPLPVKLMSYLNFEWTLFTEAIYTEFGLLCIGVTDELESDVILNPSPMEMKESTLGNNPDFFSHYTKGVFITDCQQRINWLSELDYEVNFIPLIVSRMYTLELENSILVHDLDKQEGSSHGTYFYTQLIHSFSIIYLLIVNITND